MCQKKITVAIPCYNEELTVGNVISNFRHYLPEAEIVVFDNNSSDKTAVIAQENGAVVFFEKKQGKGNVISTIFNKIETDILIIVDGDGTYSAEDVKKIINPIIKNKADIVVGRRMIERSKNMTLSHVCGNIFFKFILNIFFNSDFKDILSGYRAFRKEVYKNIPVLSRGFEVETELTLQSLDRDFKVIEVPVSYKDRPQGSNSKIREFRDGSMILFTIISLLRDYRPMFFFPLLSFLMLIVALLLGIPVVLDYLNTGLVLRLPTAVLSVTLVIISFNSLMAGLIVGAINRRQKELENVLKKISTKNNGY